MGVVYYNGDNTTAARLMETTMPILPEPGLAAGEGVLCYTSAVVVKGNCSLPGRLSAAVSLPLDESINPCQFYWEFCPVDTIIDIRPCDWRTANALIAGIYADFECISSYPDCTYVETLDKPFFSFGYCSPEASMLGWPRALSLAIYDSLMFPTAVEGHLQFKPIQSVPPDAWRSRCHACHEPVRCQQSYSTFYDSCGLCRYVCDACLAYHDNNIDEVALFIQERISANISLIRGAPAIEFTDSYGIAVYTAIGAIYLADHAAGAVPLTRDPHIDPSFLIVPMIKM